MKFGLFALELLLSDLFRPKIFFFAIFFCNNILNFSWKVWQAAQKRFKMSRMHILIRKDASMAARAFIQNEIRSFCSMRRRLCTEVVFVLLTPPSWVRIWLLDNTTPAKRDIHQRKCVPVKEFYWSIRVKLKYFSGTKVKNVNPRIFLRCDERNQNG